MHTQRPLAPSFMNRLDRRLLLSKPEVWSARTHMVLYYGILFLALLVGLSFIVPDDPRTPSAAWSWIGFVSLISLVSMIGWLIYLLRFNVFKRYGLTSGVNRLITFILYFIAIGTFVLFCYAEPFVETVRANRAYTDKEIVQDINTANLGVCRLEYDSLDHEWERDTLMATQRMSALSANEDVTYAETTVAASGVTEVNRESLRGSIAGADSVEKVNDSVYVILECPTYNLLYAYGAEKDGVDSMLSSLDIYRQVIRNYVPPDNKQQIRDELSAIRKKYQWQEEYDYEYYTVRSDFINRVRFRYGLQHISGSMNNILERKHRWDPGYREIWARVFIYTSLILTLLLFAFRHTTAKVFFLSILTAIILTLFTSLIVAFSGYNEEGVLNWVVFYFIASLAISITAFSIRRRSTVTGIAINLFLWMLPFMPLSLVVRHYEVLQREGRYDYDRHYLLQQQHMNIAEVGGMLLLLLMVGTYFHKVYRKWYAAPEN